MNEVGRSIQPAGCLRRHRLFRLRLRTRCAQAHATLRRSGLWAGIASLVLLSLVMASLVFGLLVKDFRYAYVAQYSSRLLPWQYSVSSLWVGQAGSLLLWAWFVAAMSVLFLVTAAHHASLTELRVPTFGVLMMFCCFLVTTMVFAADPMARSLSPPSDGAGLSPILQHPSMLIHPPVVFLGYAAWTIPFALALAALLSGNLNAAWTRAARPWALFAWAVLGGGILMGARWAYDELGWGGYWGWDPVENGSLIPWLFGTTAVHTLMAWRYRGMLKKTAIVLTLTTFGMCNFATFLTRSGIFSSLHAFSESPIGWLFLGLMFAIALAGGVMVFRQRHKLTAERPVASLWCREAMVLTTTLALGTLATIVCIGTLSTAISEALIGHKIVVGGDFYSNSLIPTGLIVLLLTAAAPLIPWGQPPSSTQRRMLGAAAIVAACVGLGTGFCGVHHVVWMMVNGLTAFAVLTLAGSWWLDGQGLAPRRIVGLLSDVRVRRRQYAGFLIHMGLFSVALGVVASSYGSRRYEGTMQVGERIRWANRDVQLVDIVQHDLPGKVVVEARLKIHDGPNRRSSARSGSALSPFAKRMDDRNQ